MNELTSLLLQTDPRKLSYGLDFLGQTNPVEWAYSICRDNANRGLNLQAVGSAFPKLNLPDDTLIRFEAASRPRLALAVLQKIRDGIAGHANLQLLNHSYEIQACRFEPGREFYEQVFQESLKRIFKLGHYGKMTLWFSASEHVYEAHSDLADGYLFQLEGRKKVKVWPLPDSFTEKVLYHHGDLEKLQQLPVKEFTLEAGDVLFIPGGAAHEVTVESGFSSVSISFHVGGPYPLLSLFRDLRSQHPEIGLPVEYSRIDKPNITFFQPGRLTKANQLQGMPRALRNRLIEVIDCGGISQDQLASSLDQWWENKQAHPTYPGPYPREESA